MKKIIFCLLIFCSSLSCVFSQSDSYSNKGRAYIASKEFVKKVLKFPKESDFYGGAVHETNGFGKCIVLGKFSAKNAMGVTSEYVYKIWMAHTGGDWTNQNTWSYSKLVIENTSTGEKQTFNGDNYSQKKTTSSEKNLLGKIDGISCYVIEKTSAAIRIKTNKKLTKEQIKKSIKDLNINVNTVMFNLPGKEKRGEEYGSYISGSVFYF